ncbi:MAG: hypothetical protein DWB45_12320, partial [Xanthomonadales bacterium]|nr:hypothetical protein [Xanthomonadales bacterium]
ASTPRARAARPTAAAKSAPAGKGRAARKTAAPRAAAAAARGGFATRIAEFADASLGGKRTSTRSKHAPAKGKRGSKR